MQKLKSETKILQTSIREAYASGLVDGKIVQYGKGLDVGELIVAKFGDSRLLRLGFEPQALINTAQLRLNANFTVPYDAGSHWRINGHILERDTFFMNLFSDENELLAERRKVLCGRVPLVPFLEELEALTGRDLPDGHSLTLLCRLPAAQYRQLVFEMEHILEQRCMRGDGHGGAQALIRLLAASVAASSIRDADQKTPLRNKAALVRRIRDYVDERDPGTVSMAQLCAAFSMSAPTLISVFRDMTGQTPNRFFMLQRLARARSALAGSESGAAPVKAAALEQGFTELGRFSAQYKAVYGELPSQTNARLSG
ncbi:AraC family transcriptional regulator [Shimia aestuarii]|uniref:AraC-type DNA-binding protein n=1 Tax=Shimia aestuarii TaxID=254406 RepID=A0A1I4MVE2_9RHOB|nr:helix-turn-helix domain-containing protein [Shimia aestuarii]SFM07057.1 AraC-type DNA-binding protein [Shimia aestuarii]